MGKQQFNDYYLGFDIGTNSVGWAVTDLQYKLLRFNKKDMWGSRLFEEAKTAKDRRVYRNSRRRLERRKRRLKLLEELFLEEISKVDNTFFRRLEESSLHTEDKSFDFRFPIFNDKDYTDKNYYKDYPTIYHLRNDLIKNTDKKFDIRLVYLAIHNIMKYRGHFIFEGQDFNSVTDFNEIFDELLTYLKDNLGENIDPNLRDKLKEIICSKQNLKNKDKKFSSLIDSIVVQKILYCCVGGSVNLKNIFLNYENSVDSINMSNDYDKEREKNASKLGEDILLFDICKKIYDFMILSDILKGKQYISEAKLELYNQHRDDLKGLKYLFKKYLSKKDYFDFFKNDKIPNNYLSYILTHLDDSKKNNVSSQDKLNNLAFNYIIKIEKNSSSKIDLEKSDKVVFESIKNKAKEKKLFPKLKTKDNVVIPYQINKVELEKILSNQSKYHSFLNENLCKKIITLFEFRIPYYIGPLKGKYSWTVFNKGFETEKITPWNFEKAINKEDSAEEFIKKMTNRCTYLKSEYVLPKNSLLLSEFDLLNELNKIKIKNELISLDLKNQIINELFKTTSKVTIAKFVNYLKTKQIFVEKNDITGIGDEFKSKLDSYIKFKKIIGEKIDTIQGYNFVEKCIEFKCYYGDDKELFEKAIKNTEFKDYVENFITDDELKKINKMKFNKWGRYSKKLLKEISFKDIIDGEIFESIIEALRQTNFNFMEFMSKKFNLLDKIKENVLDSGLEKFNINEYVDDLYVSPSIKRSIIQTYKIAMEIKKITGKNPKKIFIEMARGEGEKGKVPESRKTRIKKLYDDMKEPNNEFLNKLDSLKENIESFENNELRQKKLFLYFMQMGKSMYTGKDIDLNELLNTNTYDIDHIIPQSKTKDDSFDNIVLTEKTINEDKLNHDYLDFSIRNNMKSFWRFLREKGFISIEKYNRLNRSTEFTDNELADFIARQLVTTRQATLEVKKLFELIFSTETEKADVVCTKAHLVSDFREKFDIIKVREVNDAHHAQDAYLNIVVGNVFDTKFTKNYWKFTKDRGKEEIKESTNFKKIYNYDVKRNGNVAWVISTHNNKYHTITTVKKMISKKTANITEMLVEGKGEKQGKRYGFFDSNLKKKLQEIKNEKIKIVPNIPKNLKHKNISSYEIAKKYGYFGKLNPAYFILFSYEDKKGKRKFGFDRICIVDKDNINSTEKIEKYLEKELNFKNPIFLRKINIRQKIMVKNYPYRIIGFTDGKLELKNANALYLENSELKIVKNAVNLLISNEDKIKVIEKNGKNSQDIDRYIITFEKKKNNNSKNEDYDEAIARYHKEFTFIVDILCESFNKSFYENYMNSEKSIQIVTSKDKFLELKLYEKAQVITEVLKLFNRQTMSDLRKIGLVNSFGKLHGKSLDVLLKLGVEIINESVTGLFFKSERLE